MWIDFNYNLFVFIRPPDGHIMSPMYCYFKSNIIMQFHFPFGLFSILFIFCGKMVTVGILTNQYSGCHVFRRNGLALSLQYDHTMMISLTFLKTYLIPWTKTSIPLGSKPKSSLHLFAELKMLLICPNWNTLRSITKMLINVGLYNICTWWMFKPKTCQVS